MNMSDNNDAQTLNQDNFTSTISETPKVASQEDLLDVAKYTEGIVDYIEHADTPLLIAINGEWGSGKSSIMNEIKGKLCDGEDKEFYSVWINTWQFSLLDSTQSPQAVVRILQSIVNQIMALKPDYDRRDKISKLIGSIATLSTNLKSVSNLGGDPLFGVGTATMGGVAKAATALKDLFSSKSRKSSDDNAALVTQLSAEIKKLVDEVLDDPQKVHAIHIQQYVQFIPFSTYDWNNGRYCFCTRVVLAVILAILNLFPLLGFVVYNIALAVFNIIFNQILVRSYFVLKDLLINYCCHVIKMFLAAILNQRITVKNKRKGFIFLIDDLDRIEPEMALYIVEALAGTFSFEKCIFILALDKDNLINVIKSKLKNRQQKFNNAYCNLYLNKFIHMSIDMPSDFYNFNDFLKKSLEKTLFFTSDELKYGAMIDSLNKVMCYTVGRNPRSVKQLINQLSLLNILKKHVFEGDDYNQLNQNPKMNFQSILIKEMAVIVLCIRNAYPDLYMALLLRPYFKNWPFEYADNFNNNSALSETKAVIQKMAGRNVFDWECALFNICRLKKSSRQEFYNIIKVFEIIINDFDLYIQYINITQPTQTVQAEQNVYELIFKDVFKLFYRTVLSES